MFNGCLMSERAFRISLMISSALRLSFHLPKSKCLSSISFVAVFLRVSSSNFSANQRLLEELKNEQSVEYVSYGKFAYCPEDCTTSAQGGMEGCKISPSVQYGLYCGEQRASNCSMIEKIPPEG